MEEAKYRLIQYDNGYMAKPLKFEDCDSKDIDRIVRDRKKKGFSLLTKIGFNPEYLPKSENDKILKKSFAGVLKNNKYGLIVVDPDPEIRDEYLQRYLYEIIIQPTNYLVGDFFVTRLTSLLMELHEKEAQYSYGSAWNSQFKKIVRHKYLVVKDFHSVEYLRNDFKNLVLAGLIERMDERKFSILACDDSINRLIEQHIFLKNFALLRT